MTTQHETQKKKHQGLALAFNLTMHISLQTGGRLTQASITELVQYRGNRVCQDTTDSHSTMNRDS